MNKLILYSTTIITTAYASSSECVNFLAMGDYGSRGYQQKQVAKGLAAVAAERDPAFIAGIGDNIYADGAEGRTDLIVSWWSDIYPNVYESLRRPWYIVTGNHDWHTDARTERDFTTDNSNVGGWWQMPNFWYKKSFQAKGTSLDVFFIDTMVWVGSNTANNAIGGKPVASQYAWLYNALEESTADYKIVMGHHPVYSGGSHGITHKLLEELDPLMRKFGVQMFISGHDHNQQYIKHKGLNYIVAGSGGKTTGSGRPEYPQGALREMNVELGFMGVEICNPKSASFQFFDNDGRTVSTWTFSSDRPEFAEAEAPIPHRIQKPCGKVMLNDVDLVCSDDGCKVLANIKTGENCREYCRQNGLGCVGGWEEVNETCNVLETLGCDGRFAGTSDLMCECDPNGDGKEPESPVASPTPPPDGNSCMGVQLNDVEKVCSSNGCKVLADKMRNRTCRQYCDAHNLQCIGGWEEQNENCNQIATIGCDDTYGSTSDLICECGKKETPPAPGPNCHNVSFRNVEKVCAADGCKVLADKMRGKTCGEYCADHNLTCEGGWEEEAENCVQIEEIGCDRPYGSTSDLICQCKPPMIPASAPVQLPAPTPSPTPAPEEGESGLIEYAKYCQNISAKGKCTKGGCLWRKRKCQGKSPEKLSCKSLKKEVTICEMLGGCKIMSNGRCGGTFISVV